MRRDHVRIYLGRGGSHSHSFIQLLRSGDADRRFHILASHSNPHAAGFLLADQKILEPSKLDDASYVEYCLEQCGTEKVDVFIPGRSIRAFSDRKQAFHDQGVRIMLAADASVARLMDDKLAQYRDLENTRTSAPDFLPFTSIGEFEQAYEVMRTRHESLCIKPAVSTYAIGFRFISKGWDPYSEFWKASPFRISIDELRRTFASRADFPTMLLMEFLPGAEFSVDCLGHRGQLLIALPRHKLPRGMGQRVEEDKAIIAQCEQLTTKYALSGLYNIQFRYGATGAKVLEINPRVSGGIAITGYTGVNLPYWAICEEIDGPQPAPDKVRWNVRVLEVPTYLEAP